MKFKRIPFLLGLLALLLSVLACGGSFSTANISDTWMATDAEGNNHTTSFAQSDDFYAFAQVNNAADDTKLKAVWTAVNAQDTDPNLVINETEFASGDGVVYFQLTNDNLWPIGSYKVDIYLNDTLANTLTFEVK